MILQSKNGISRKNPLPINTVYTLLYTQCMILKYQSELTLMNYSKSLMENKLGNFLVIIGNFLNKYHFINNLKKNCFL